MNKTNKCGGTYIQYGCGICAPDAWSNFDASARLRLERMPALGLIWGMIAGRLFPANVHYGNILRGLPVRDGSVAGVYCSHVLEHLPRNELPIALRNTLRILVPGGIFRLVVPDLHWRAARYLAGVEKDEPSAADKFMDGCHLGMRRGSKTFIDTARDLVAKSRHLWMYDFAALKLALEQAGFVGVRRCHYGDSADPMFIMVEDKGRFVDAGNQELAMEALRPRRSNDDSAISP